MTVGTVPVLRLARRAMPNPQCLQCILILLLSWAFAAGPCPALAAATEDVPLELDLEQCIQFALRHNAAVQVARQHALAAGQTTRIAFAEYLPKIVATAQYTKLDEDRILRTRLDDEFRSVSLDAAAWWGIARAAGTAAANAAFDNRAIDPAQTFNNARAQAAKQFPSVQSAPVTGDNIFEAQVMLTQPLFTGGKIYYGNKMAELNQEIQEFGVGVREDETVLNVTAAYLGALASGRIRTELEDLHARLDALRKGTQSALDAGSDKASTRDIEQLAVALAKTVQDVAESERAHNVALAALREAMGLDENGPLKLKDVDPEDPDLPSELTACEALALERRPEVQQVGLARRLREHAVSKAKAGYAPDVAAFAGVRYFREDAHVLDPDNHKLLAGVSLRLPLFEGFATSAEVAQARFDVEAARFTETQVRRAIRLQVQEAYYSVCAAQEKTYAAEDMVRHAEQFSRITTAARVQSIGADYRRVLVISDEPLIQEFKEVPDVREELEADTMETQSKIGHVAAALELNEARARLARATGARLHQEATNASAP